MDACALSLFSMIIQDHSPHVVSNPSVRFLNRLLCAWSQGVGAYPSKHFYKNTFYRADCGLWEDTGNRESTQRMALAGRWISTQDLLCLTCITYTVKTMYKNGLYYRSSPALRFTMNNILSVCGSFSWMCEDVTALYECRSA